MDDFLPQFAGVDGAVEFRIFTEYRVFLLIIFIIRHRLHKTIINTNRYIGAGYFTLLQFGVDKIFRIGMINGHRQHQGTTAAILSHFPGGIGITLHKRHDTGGCQRGIFNR